MWGRVVAAGDVGAAVDAPGRGGEVEQGGGREADVDDGDARSADARREAVAEGLGRGAIVAAEDHLVDVVGAAEVRAVGAADQLRDLRVEVVANDAADVVGAEHVGVEGAGGGHRRPAYRRVGAGPLGVNPKLLSGGSKVQPVGLKEVSRPPMEVLLESGDGADGRLVPTPHPHSSNMRAATCFAELRSRRADRRKRRQKRAPIEGDDRSHNRSLVRWQEDPSCAERRNST